MKALVCIILLSFSITVTAQKDNSNLLNTTDIKHGSTYQTQNKAKLLTPIPNGNVYALPLDNMHCLVPNLKVVATIPNGLSYPIISGMGNPFKKEEIIPNENDRKLILNNSLLITQLHKGKGSKQFNLSK